MRSKRPPSYPRRPHSSGQARIKITGEVHYLGIFGSPESHLAYQEILRNWHAQQTSPAALPVVARTVDDVLGLFLAAAESGERPTSKKERTHFTNLRTALVAAKLSTRQAATFDVDHLEALRRIFVGRFSRRHATRQLVRLRTVWRWAERKKFVPPGSWAGLMALKLGTGEAPDPVPPVPEFDLTKTLAELPRIPRAMVEVQLLTGARPSEILVLRPADFDRRGAVWVAEVSEHKSAWRGHRKRLLFGPRAQKILAPFMLREPTAYLFDPREAVADTGRLTRKRAKRLGRRYSYYGYRQAIERACYRAGVAVWAPGRLRHNACDRLVEEFGAEVARLILGHRELTTTRNYRQDDLKTAMKAMEKAG